MRFSRPIRVFAFAMFLASQKCISQNRNSDSCGPGEISLKYMATGDFPVETIDLPFGFVAIAATS